MPKEAVSPWISRFAPAIRTGGRVLDLAAGGGRHTRFLRGLGLAVVACDRNGAALQAACAGDPLCEVATLDLEDGGPWRLGGGYDGIVVTNYLHRPLLPELAAALAPGGLLLYETFLLGNERFGKPSNPDFLLRPNELFETYAPSLTILAFEQGIIGSPNRAAVQRFAAVRSAPGSEVVFLPE